LLLDQLELGPETRAEVFRRMTFNVAAAICDDHTKNFTFLLPEGEAWRLSPAYDVTHAHAPDSRWTRQHLMAVNGRSVGIRRADVMEVGDRFAVPGASGIVGQVLEAVAKWRTFADEARVPEATTEHIAADIDRWSAPLRA
jgi:serine/threonine-protein kinase HipA